MTNACHSPFVIYRLSFVIRHSTFRHSSFGHSPMLPTAVVYEIDRLLRDGDLSHRKIAVRLGVSRGTVSAIAAGRRGLYGKDPRASGRHSIAPTSPPARCRRCGYRVYLPCLICQARGAAAAKSARGHW
jgi:hypothetical protein